MDARMGAEAITTRIGAIALPLGIILLVAATAIHPSREAPMDNPAVFMEYVPKATAGLPYTSPSGSLLYFLSVVWSLFTTPLRQSRRRMQEWRALALLRRC